VVSCSFSLLHGLNFVICPPQSHRMGENLSFYIILPYLGECTSIHQLFWDTIRVSGCPRVWTIHNHHWLSNHGQGLWRGWGIALDLHKAQPVVVVMMMIIVVTSSSIIAIVIIIVTLRANTPYRPHPFYAVLLGISNVRLYIQLGRSTRVFREYKFPTPVKLLHSSKIFNKGLILPPPLNFYIHWRSSIRV